MRKKLFIRAGIGVLLGVASVLIIPTIFNRGEDGAVHYVSGELVARVGSPAAAMLLTLLLYGLYGALCMGGTLFYEIERWPLALATAAHYLAISLGYLLSAYILRWSLTWRLILIIEGLMTVGFFLIWLIMWLLYKAQVRKLNELIRERDRKSAHEQMETKQNNTGKETTK